MARAAARKTEQEGAPRRAAAEKQAAEAADHRHFQEQSRQATSSSDDDEHDEDFAVDDMIKAAQMGNRARLRKTLHAGMSVDTAATADGGPTLLMLAAQAKQKACLKLLLQRGAKVDLVDADGWSALMFAANADDDEAIRML
eukprot:COSAG06_NODE_22413_length_724_cov_1.068800_2_plen_141_part_01